MRWTAILLGVGLGAASASAQTQVCTRDGSGNLLPGHREMHWPDAAPMWDFCFVRPNSSIPGPNGSGLELYNVYYRGHLVFKRAHAPILNVLYSPGGCGCYRDWSDQEHVFQANNVIAPGYAEPTTPARTVCDNAGMDLGSFAGVAAEKGTDELLLTTQYEAGWYRYTMKWRFHTDGTITGSMGFAAVEHPCTSAEHIHHNYWRLDFDIDNPGGDSIEFGRSAVGSTNLPTRPVGFEGKRKHSPGQTWVVRDQQSGRGYMLSLGNTNPVDTFSVADFWFLKHRSTEMYDSGLPGPACAIKIDGYLNNESVDNEDVVVWVRGGAFHDAGDLDDCHVVD